MATKKSRSKVKEAILPINDWAQADEFVRKIGDMTAAVVTHQIEEKKEIDQIKLEHGAEIDALKAAIDIHARSLEAFAANHTADFGEARSKKLNFGLVGWRKSSSIIIKSIASTIISIKGVFGKNASTYLRFKEEPDKEAIGKLKDEQLAAIGARRENKDVFFVEPSIPEAAEH